MFYGLYAVCLVQEEDIQKTANEVVRSKLHSQVARKKGNVLFPTNVHF